MSSTGKKSWLLAIFSAFAAGACALAPPVAQQAAGLPGADSAPNSLARESVSAPNAAASASEASRDLDPAVSYGAPVALPELEAQQFVRSQPVPAEPFPIVLNRTVQHYVNQYVRHPGMLAASFRRSAPYLAEMVRELEGAGVPGELVYLSFAESAFSPMGAGPWQLSRATARRFGLTVNRFVDERRDPIKSTRAAARYLARLHQRAGNWHVAMACWNEGEGFVPSFVRLPRRDYDHLMRHMPKRTRALLNRFMAVAVIAADARAYGFGPALYYEPLRVQLVPVGGGTALRQVAARYHTTVRKLRELNPALLRDRLPLSTRRYTLRVPDRQGAEPGSAPALRLIALPGSGARI